MKVCLIALTVVAIFGFNCGPFIGRRAGHEMYDGPSISVPTSYGTITCSLDKYTYKLGDKIRASFKIKCSPDTALLVWDPKCENSFSVGYSSGFKCISASFQYNDDAGLEVTYRKIRIPPSDSIVFDAYTIVDSVAGDDNPQLCTFRINFNLMLYEDKFADLTKGDNCLVGVDPFYYSIAQKVFNPTEEIIIPIYRNK